MPSLNTLFPVTIFQEKIIFFGFVFLLGIVSILGATLGATPGIFLLFALGVAFLGAFLFPRAAVWAMMTLTILFERFFTLQPIVLGKSILKVYPIDMMVLGLFCAFVVHWILSRHRKSEFAWQDIWIVLFFAYITILFLLSVSGILGSDGAVAFSTWKQYVFYGLIFFFVRLSVASLDDLKLFLKVAFGSILAASIFLIIGSIRGEGLWSEFTPLSTSGVRILAFPHTLYFSLALIISFLSLSITTLAERWRKILFVLIPVLAIGIVGSLMRHLWLGLACALSAGFILLWRKNKSLFIRNTGAYLGIFTVIAMLFLSVLALMPKSDLTESVFYSGNIISTRVTSIGNTYDESAAWRGVVWQSAFERFSQHPLIGIGLGNSVPVEIGDYRDIIEVRNIHNSWFALIVQTGFVGSLLFLLFLSSLMVSVFRLKAEGETDMAMRAILLALSVFFAVVFLFQPYLETNLLSLFFWMLVGLMAIISRKGFFEQS